MQSKTRREFLKGGAALAAGSAVFRASHAFASPDVVTLKTTPLSQFDYKDVQLLDGPMLEQFRHNHSLFLNLNEDSMLKPFRQLSGLPAPGEDGAARRVEGGQWRAGGRAGVPVGSLGLRRRWEVVNSPSPLAHSCSSWRQMTSVAAAIRQANSSAER